MKNELPAIEYLRTILKYDETSPSGLRWISRHKTGISYGRIAGTKAKYGRKQNYVTWNINIDKTPYKNHNIIWKLVYNEDISENLEIDHIDRDACNNKIENLRLVTKSENMINKRKNSRNSSGYSGVYWCESRNEYQIQASKDKKWITIGYADSLNEAIYMRIKHQIKEYGKLCERELKDIPKEVFDRLVSENII